MTSRAAEAEAINRKPWVADMAARGAYWFRQQQDGRLADSDLNKLMVKSAGRWAVSNFAVSSEYRINSIFRRDPELEGAASSDEYVLQGLADRRLQEEWDAYSWFRNGLPRIRVDHKLAASLCATSVPPECVPYAKPPWSFFVVDVPEGLLAYNDEEGFDRIEHLYFCESERGANWQIHAIVGDAIMALSADLTSAADVAADAADRLQSKYTSVRTDGMALRLALGVLLELNQHRPGGAVGRGKHARSARRDEPRFSIVQLTRDVKVDCRQHVRDYIAGASGKTLSVQHMVRGHWKMQTHGEKGSQRKFIHVEPYWRGPDDAPIALRNHVLTGNTVPRAEAANDG